jgi:hypothetical protein
VNQAGEHAPQGQHFELHRRTGLLITGPILLGVGYLGGAFVGVVNTLLGSRTTPSFFNAIPFVGPLLGEVAYSQGGFNLFNASTLFAVVLTGLQVAGTILTIFGIPQREVLVDDDVLDPQRRGPENRDSRLPPIQWSLMPSAPGSLLGVSLMVRN